MSELNSNGDPLRPFGAFGVTALGVAALVGVWTAYWLAMSNSVRGGVEAWIEGQASRGVRVTYRSLELEGYPFWLGIRIAGARVLVEGGAPVEWRTPLVLARARPWRLSTLEIDLTGAHEIVGARRVAMTVRRLDATVNVGQSGAVSGTVTGEGVNAEISRAGVLSAAALDVDFAWRGPGSGAQAVPLRLGLGIDGAVLPAAWASPLGGDVETLRLTVQVTGRLGHLRDPDLLTNWRDDGGALEVSRFDLRHGPLRMDGDGAIALDRDMQPVGAFTVRAEGFMETLDALRERRLIGLGKATAAKLVLMVLAARPAGQPPRIEAPLTLQDRELTLKSLALMKVPRIDWTRILGSGGP